MRPRISRNVLGSSCHEGKFTAKFNDNSSHAVAIDLRKCLIQDDRDYDRPVTYRQRTGRTINNHHNSPQLDMDDFAAFTVRNKFLINFKKSSVMLFNFSRTADFEPEVVPDGERLQAVCFTKLLG